MREMERDEGVNRAISTEYFREDEANEWDLDLWQKNELLEDLSGICVEDEEQGNFWDQESNGVKVGDIGYDDFKIDWTRYEDGSNTFVEMTGEVSGTVETSLLDYKGDEEIDILDGESNEEQIQMALDPKFEEMAEFRDIDIVHNDETAIAGECTNFNYKEAFDVEEDHDLWTDNEDKMEDDQISKTSEKSTQEDPDRLSFTNETHSQILEDQKQFPFEELENVQEGEIWEAETNSDTERPHEPPDELVAQFAALEGEKCDESISIENKEIDAQNSEITPKPEMDDVMNHIEYLENENKELKEQITKLEMENCALKEKLNEFDIGGSITRPEEPEEDDRGFLEEGKSLEQKVKESLEIRREAAIANESVIGNVHDAPFSSLSIFEGKLKYLVGENFFESEKFIFLFERLGELEDEICGLDGSVGFLNERIGVNSGVLKGLGEEFAKVEGSVILGDLVVESFINWVLRVVKSISIQKENFARVQVVSKEFASGVEGQTVYVLNSLDGLKSRVENELGGTKDLVEMMVVDFFPEALGRIQMQFDDLIEGHGCSLNDALSRVMNGDEFRDNLMDFVKERFELVSSRHIAPLMEQMGEYSRNNQKLDEQKFLEIMSHLKGVDEWMSRVGREVDCVVREFSGVCSELKKKIEAYQEETRHLNEYCSRLEEEKRVMECKAVELNAKYFENEKLSLKLSESLDEVQRRYGELEKEFDVEREKFRRMELHLEEKRERISKLEKIDGNDLELLRMREIISNLQSENLQFKSVNYGKSLILVDEINWLKSQLKKSQDLVLKLVEENKNLVNHLSAYSSNENP